MLKVFGAIGGIFLTAGLTAYFLFPANIIYYSSEVALKLESLKPFKKEKTLAERISEAKEKSQNIKGLYMTADVANGEDAPAERLRNEIIWLAKTAEINGIVIDVKEVCGSDYNEEKIKELLQELRQNNIWSIARIVVFKDDSQIGAHPEWYLKRKTAVKTAKECVKKLPDLKKPAGVVFWQDKRGGYWLDPASEGARNYILEFSKKMIDFGFDELQFDYIRFPSDGDVEKAIYPAYDEKTPKYETLKSFFEFLNKNLKAYKPEIILSVDLFGYVAIRPGDTSVGQRLDDIGDNFDYISFMLYPSHYYNGFYLPPDNWRNLPAVDFNVSKTRLNPDVVIHRSLLFAKDFIEGRLATTSIANVLAATSTMDFVENLKPRSSALLRPWLEDFFHEEDKKAGRPYGAEKVRLQIKAAENSGANGWLLWNASNVYTKDALQSE